MGGAEERVSGAQSSLGGKEGERGEDGVDVLEGQHEEWGGEEGIAIQQQHAQWVGGNTDSQLTRLLAALHTTQRSLRTWLNSKLLATRMALEGAAYTVHAARDSMHVRALKAAVRNSRFARALAPHASAALRAALDLSNQPHVKAVAHAAAGCARQLGSVWVASLRMLTTTIQGLHPAAHAAQRAAVAAVSSIVGAGAQVVAAVHGWVVGALAAAGLGPDNGGAEVVVLLLALAVSAARGAWVYVLGLFARQVRY